MSKREWEVTILRNQKVMRVNSTEVAEGKRGERNK